MPSSPPECSRRVILSLEWREPEDAFRRLCRQRFPIWLDSGGPVGALSRYSYLCIDPIEVLEKRDRCLCRNGQAVAGGGFDAFGGLVRRWRGSFEPGPVPFMGGTVGLLGYGLAGELERLPARHPVDPDLPELWVALYDLVLAFDRVERRCWLISTGYHPTRTPGERSEWFASLLQAPHPPEFESLPRLSFRPDRPQADYCRMVRAGLDRIESGDIFQANLTARHVARRPRDLDPASVYLSLRSRTPAAFGAYIGWSDGRALASASPERFIRLWSDGAVETRPIKGTISRRLDPADDARAATILQASLRDRAENLMIVDLMRNDLARVAQPGSVSVPTLFAIDSIATLHHLVSTVTATLRDGEDAVSLLRASFPGGSVTGAPKIRAMEIIDELEASGRGPYCGCVVWIGHDGAMDSSIVIRTLLLTTEQVIAHAGGGVVADSSPEAEHAEMMAKIAPLLALFQ